MGDKTSDLLLQPANNVAANADKEKIRQLIGLFYG
jgi:hypothetical protein